MGNCCQAAVNLLLQKNPASSPPLEQSAVGFDPKYHSPHISVTNKRKTAEGSATGGTVLCDTPIDQLRAFWEFTLEDLGSGSGQFAVGVMRRANLKPPPNDNHVLSRCFDPNDERTKCLSSNEAGVTFTKGDTVGVALDMNYKRLTFYMNGVSMQVEIKLSPKFSAPFPCVQLANGVRIRANFQGPFDCFPTNDLNPQNYDGIVAARSIL